MSREVRFFTAEDPAMTQVRAIRQQVFVQDLGVPPAQEFDQADLPGSGTAFALLYIDGAAQGTGRVQVQKDTCKIGRIALLPAARGKGAGRRLVCALVRQGVTQGACRVAVDARLEAVGFYEKLGFVPCGTPFMQRGMRHVPMELTGAALKCVAGEREDDKEKE